MLENSNYFHSLEVVSRWRDPQLQVDENWFQQHKGKILTTANSQLFPLLFFHVEMCIARRILILENIQDNNYIKLELGAAVIIQFSVN